MNRIVLFVMVVTSIGAHVTLCEWDVCKHEPIVPPSRGRRMIFYESRGPRSYDVYLLSRPGFDREEATLYGVYLPLMVLGAAVFFTQIGSRKSGAGQSTSPHAPSGPRVTRRFM